MKLAPNERPEGCSYTRTTGSSGCVQINSLFYSHPQWPVNTEVHVFLLHGGIPFDPHVKLCPKGWGRQMASQSAENKRHLTPLYLSAPWRHGAQGYPWAIRVLDFEDPDTLPAPVDSSRWHPSLLTATADEYRQFVAEHVELAMSRDTAGYWTGSVPDIQSNLYYLKLAIVSSIQLYRHRLTHGLVPACSRLHVIDKSCWLSRFVKKLFKVPSNPYPWIDELCAAPKSYKHDQSVGETED